MFDMRLHEKLKRLCGERRWGQTDLIDAVGDISKSTMHNWFNGKTLPDLGSALKIAKALDVPLDWLADPVATFPPPHVEPTPVETTVLKLIRALQLDEEEALRRLATPAAAGDAWIPGSVRDQTPLLSPQRQPRRETTQPLPDSVPGRLGINPDAGGKPKRKGG